MKKRVLMIMMAALLCMTLLLSSCKKPGNSDSTRGKEYDGVQSVEAYIDYAKRLEANGDYEAAAQIYEIISKTAGSTVFSGMENPAADMMKEYAEAQDIFSELGH